MALRVFVRKFAVLWVCVLVLSGCDRDAPLFVVKAVAAGVPSLAPFFDENQGLGRDDARVTTVRAAHGGLQQGDTPGLYGGSEQPAICDVVRLKKFLTDPANERKARAWATALFLSTDEIPGYLERLTPVLLRHDTLVRNHDYKKGKAVPFDALLQSGIAILVDEQGLPAVKCSCGNPLRPFEGDTTRITVEFDDRNEEWKGYEKASVVAVRSAPRKVERLALVDVHEPDRGIARPVGTAGEDDAAFDTRERRAVPGLAGQTFGQASRQLAQKGLAVGFEGGGLPPDDARVTASDPPAGTELRFGAYVTLSVAGGTSGGSPEEPTPTSTPPGPGSSGSTRDPSASTPSASDPSAPDPSRSSSSTSSPSTKSPPASSGPPSPSASGPSGSGSAGPGPTSGPPSPRPPSSAPPSSAPPPSPEPPSPTKNPASSSAPPSSEPTTSAPATSAPVSGTPSTVEPPASTTA